MPQLTVRSVLRNFGPRRLLRRPRLGWRSAALSLLLLPCLLVLSACLSGSSGLPPGLNFPTVTKLTITGYVASNPSAIPSPVLPSGTQFVAYTQLVVFVGGATPYSCAVTGLPMGLTLNPTFTATPTGGYCTLSGTPQVFGSFPLVFNITDSSIPPEIATNNTVTLVINPAFGFTGYTMGPGEVGVPYSQNFTFTGGNPNYTCSIPANGTAGGLPVGTGLSMNSAPTGLNCVLAGTPTAADAAAPINIVVSVMDSASGGSPATTATTNTLGMPPVVTINPHLALSAPLVLGTGEQNVPYMQTISTTGGIAPLTVCSFAPALPAGLTTMISGSNCTIMGTPTVAFAPTLLTLTATDSGSPNTAGMMGTINPKPTSNLTILAQTSLSAFTLGTGQAGSMYNQLVAFTGGNAPYNCSETGLPPGTGLAVTVSGMNCQLSGMPTAQDVAASPMNVMITVTDTPPSASSTAPGTSTQSSAFTVLAQLVLNPFTLLAGEAGAMYSQALPFTGGNAPFTCTGAGFPVGTGLAVTTVANTCVVSGTPTAQDATASPQTIMVTVKDTAPSGSSQQGSSTQSSSLTIYTALTITVTLGNGEVNSAYSSDPAVNPGAVEPAISGGNPAATTYTCTFVPVPPAPSPISGLNVTWNGKPAGAGPGCTVSGTPTAAFGFPAAATIQLQVTEGQAPSTSSQAGVSVPATSNAITIFPALNLALTLGSGEVNAAYATTNPGATEPSISGGMTSIGTTTYTCAFVGAFPPGLSSAVPPLSPVWNGMTGANAGCTVQGTPTAPFGFPVAATTQVKVTESPAPSNYSAAGTFTATSNPISIFPALSLAATLGNGEVMAAYSSDPAVNPGAVEPAISGGNPAVTTYICAFTGTSPAGLNAVWNGSTGAAAGCTVSGTPSGTFGFPAAASSTIQVTEGQTPGNYSAAGSFTATSNAITIYPQVALDPFTLGDGETNAGYSHTGINVTAATGSPGAPPPQSYTCSSSNLPTGLTASAVGASCQVTGTPTATNAASVTVMVTENVRPSAYSVPGSNTRASTGNLNIFPGVTFNSAMFSLGNGAVDQVFNETNPPAFMNGNGPFTCAFTGAMQPTGISTSGASGTACQVTGNAPGPNPPLNSATAAFGAPAGQTVNIQVKDTPRSADQTGPSMDMSSSQSSFEIFSQLTVMVPALVPNGLDNVPYPGITFTAMGGLSNGSMVTWSSTGTLPPGLTLDPATGMLTGKPNTPGSYMFTVTATDNTMSSSTNTFGANPGVATTANITLKVLGRLAFISGTATHSVEVIDVSSNTWKASIALPAGAVPTGIAVTARGDAAYVADSANNTIIPIDTMNLTAGSPVALPGVCVGPADVAATPDPTPTIPGHDRLWVTCPGSNAAAVFDTTNLAPTLISGFGPFAGPVSGLAITSDNSLVFSTGGGGFNLLIYFNNAGAPSFGNIYPLSGAATNPSQVALATHGAGVYAFITEKSSPIVEVQDVTSVPSSAPTFITDIGLPAASNVDVIASDPVQSRLFVSLPGTNQFAVIDNSLNPPALFAAPYPLPIPGGGDNPGGLTVAPSSSGAFPFQAYITVKSGPNANNVDIIDDATTVVPPPIGTDPASPVDINTHTPGSQPGRIASIPVPAAGLGFSTAALPDAVEARTYKVYALIRGGKGPYTCTATIVPSGWGVAFAAVPSGPLAGKPACLINGTAPAASTPAVTITVTDSSMPPQMAPVTLSLNIRHEFAFNNTALPVGVQNRSYGLAPQTPPVEDTTLASGAGAPPIQPNTCTLSGSGAVANPNLAAAVSGTGTGCALSSSGSGVNPPMTTTSAGAAFALTFGATDTGITDPSTGIQAVPPNTVTMSSPVAFAVNQPLAFPAFALGNGEVTAAYSQTVPTNLLSGGGAGSLIGVGAGCAFGVVPGGLGIAPDASGDCVITGPPSATFSNMVTLMATDTGNSAVPSGTAMGTSMNVFTIFPQVTVASAPLGDGEQGAAYSNTNPGTMPISITLGNPASASYTCSFVGGNIPAGLKIVWNGMTGAAAGCTVTGAGPLGVASATFSGTTQVQVTDSAPSASSGAGTSAATTTSSINIFPPLALAATLGSGEVGAAYNSTNPGATEPAISGGNPGATMYTCSIAPPGNNLVNLTAAWNTATGALAGCTVSGTPNATFGFPAAASTTIQVTEAPGPGNYSSAGSFTATSNTFSIFPALSLAATLGDGEVGAAYNSTNPGATEPAISGGNPAATTYMCSSSTLPTGLSVAWNGNAAGAGPGCTVSSTPTSNAGFVPPGGGTAMIQATEGQAPSNYSAAGSITATSNTIRIFPQVTLAALPQPLPQGTTGTAYGPVNVAITNGNQPYATCNPTGFPAGITFMVNATNCAIAGTPTATDAGGAVSLTVTDTAPSNYSAAATSSAQPSNLTVVQGTVLAPTPSLPTGVTDRTYNTSIAITNGQNGDAFTCSDMGTLPAGLQVVWNGTMLPGAAACNISSTGPITATVPAGITVTIQATDNTTTSSSTVTPSLIVNPELSIQLEINGTTVAGFGLTNGLVAIPYGAAPAPTVQFVVAPNTGNGTTVMWFGARNGATCSTPSGTLPPAIGVGMGNGMVTGTPTTPSASPAVYSFPVCVKDMANAATPAGAVTSASNYTLDVLDALAYSAGTGTTKSIEIFGTETSVSSQNALLKSIGPRTGTPNGVAVTGNGRFAIVTEDATDQIDVIDTLTNNPISGSPFALSVSHCGTPAGAAADSKFIYVACDSTAGSNVEEVLVLDVQKFAALQMGITASTVTEITTGAGTKPDSIAFKNDDTRAYVTLSGTNQLLIIDNTLATPAAVGTASTLSATSGTPKEVTVAPNPSATPTKTLAYVAKQTGGVTFVSASSNANCSKNNGGGSTVNCSFAIAASGTVVVMVGRADGVAVTSVHDNGATGGNTYTPFAGCSSDNGTSTAVDCYVSSPIGASKSATTITVVLSNTSFFTVSAAEYDGVTSVGNVNAVNTYTAPGTTAPTISLTTQDNSNVCVGGFQENATLTIDPGASGINVRTQITNSNQTGAILDTSIGPTGTCNISASIGAQHTWAVGALELRGGGNGPGVDVVDVTTDSPTLSTIPEPANTMPTNVAVIPGTFDRVYVSLPETLQFDTIDNTSGTPASIANAPFALQDSRTGLDAAAGGITIPPSAGAAFVYFTSPNISTPAVADVLLYDDGVPPALDGTTPFIAATANSKPSRVASIPIPH